MKKTTTIVALAMPCPKLKVKRPMNRGSFDLFEKLKRYYLIPFLCTILSLIASRISAQEQTSQNKQTNKTGSINLMLKGRVTDLQSTPLTGATITENQSLKTTQTDQNGNFILVVETPSGTITISYLGYQSLTLYYNTGSEQQVKLEEDRALMQAIEINTGYYSTTKKLYTGAISSVQAKQIEKQPVANPLSSLQGRVTGAYIQQTSGTPGGNINITIRGRNGIDATSNPLYLVDGIPFGGASLANSFSASLNVFTSGGSSPLNNIAPEDIESIDILKDADATAIYGSRGANGVVLITTKKGKKGRTSIEASGQSGLSTSTSHLSMLSTTDYLALRKLAFTLDGASPKPADYDLHTWSQSRETDWQKQLIGQSASFSNYRTSFSGGSQNHNFLLSATHHRQGTIYDTDLGYKRTAIHLATTHQSTDGQLKATASASYSTDELNWLNADLTQRSLNLSPNAPALRTASGSLNWENNTFINPLKTFEHQYAGSNTNLTAAAKLAYQPIQSLELSLNLGYSSLSLDDRSSIPASFYTPSEGRTSATSTSDFGNSSQKGWSSELQASYSLILGKARISLLLGSTLQHQDRKGSYLRGTGFASDALIYSLASANTTTLRAAHQSSYRYGGIYARANYTLKEKYILNLTTRRDGSSRFGTDRRFGNFGAIGVAYLFSTEKWIQHIFPALSIGKLRASYGSSGNDQIGDYEYLDTYAASQGYNQSAGLAPLRLFNPDFSWEKNRKAEVGLELGFFNDRLNFSLNHYRNLATAQLVDYPLSAVSGFTSIRSNLPARIANRGLEIEFSSRNIQRKNFQWQTSFNLTIPKNTLVSFPGLESSSYASTLVIGRSLSSVKLYQLQGVDPQKGTYVYTDFNNDGVISTLDRQVIGERKQRYYGGLDNSLTYRKLELSFLFQFVSHISNSFRGQYGQMPGTAANQPKAYQGKYWTAPGDIAELQRPSSGQNSGATQGWSRYSLSDVILTRADFVRLKNVSLSCRTDKIIPGKMLRLFAQGQNLWTITDYFGLDPESANSTLPLQRTFTLGLQLTL
jgi:TonB-linked SusC/RagA family outer membrane protein